MPSGGDLVWLGAAARGKQAVAVARWQFGTGRVVPGKAGIRARSQRPKDTAGIARAAGRRVRAWTLAPAMPWGKVKGQGSYGSSSC